MSKLSAQPVFVHTSISDTDEQWINIDNGDGTFTSQRMTMAQHRDLINSSPFFADDYLADAGNNKNLLVYRSGSIMASNFNTRKSLTSSGASDDNKWWKVFEYLVTTDFDSDCFKVQMNELNESTGLGKSVIFDILLKRQDPYIYVNVNVESGLSSFDLANFDVLYNSTTKKISIYYRVIPTFTFTNWLVLNGKVVNVSQMIWSNTLIGASLSGETSDAFTAKTISLNKVNGVYTLPSTAPTTGQVLGYLGAGTTTWVSAGASGIVGIANSSGVYTYYATLTLAMTAAVAGQTIELFTDVIETGAVTITLKDGVNINGNGHTYAHSYSTGNSNTLQNISGTISCVISNLNVIRSGRSNGTTGDYVLNATVNDSQFFIYNSFFESTYGEAVNLNGTTNPYKPHSGNLYVRAYLTAIKTQGSISGFTGQSTSSGRGVYSTGGILTRCTGISISGNGITGTSNGCYGYSTSGIALGDSGNFSNCYGNSITYRAGDAGIFSNCTLVSSSGYAASNGTYKNCTLISASGNAAGPYNLNPHDNCYLESTSNITVGGGYSGVFRNCVVVSNWNNAGGHGFQVGSTGNIITNCHIKVSNASANCINAGAISIKYASNIFEGATTAVNASITQGIINTEDNQGNILL